MIEAKVHNYLDGLFGTKTPLEIVSAKTACSLWKDELNRIRSKINTIYAITPPLLAYLITQDMEVLALTNGFAGLLAGIDNVYSEIKIMCKKNEFLENPGEYMRKNYRLKIQGDVKSHLSEHDFYGSKYQKKSYVG